MIDKRVRDMGSVTLPAWLFVMNHRSNMDCVLVAFLAYYANAIEPLVAAAVAGDATVGRAA